MICYYLIHSQDVLDDIDTKINPKSNIIRQSDDPHSECNICLERYYGQDNETTNRLEFCIKHNYSNYIKHCICDCYVHNECLSIWVINKRSCIICRRPMSICDDEGSIIVTRNDAQRMRLFFRCLFIITHISRSFFLMSLYVYFIYIGYSLYSHFIK
jgi:hypothetical protein